MQLIIFSVSRKMSTNYLLIPSYIMVEMISVDVEGSSSVKKNKPQSAKQVRQFQLKSNRKRATLSKQHAVSNNAPLKVIFWSQSHKQFHRRFTRYLTHYELSTTSNNCHFCFVVGERSHVLVFILYMFIPTYLD